jgi:hypothetical protein
MTQFHYQNGPFIGEGGPMGRQTRVKLEDKPPSKQQGKPMQVQKTSSQAAKTISTKRTKLG